MLLFDLSCQRSKDSNGNNQIFEKVCKSQGTVGVLSPYAETILCSSVASTSKTIHCSNIVNHSRYEIERHNYESYFICIAFVSICCISRQCIY